MGAIVTVFGLLAVGRVGQAVVPGVVFAVVYSAPVAIVVGCSLVLTHSGIFIGCPFCRLFPCLWLWVLLGRSVFLFRRAVVRVAFRVGWRLLFPCLRLRVLLVRSLVPLPQGCSPDRISAGLPWGCPVRRFWSGPLLLSGTPAFLGFFPGASAGGSF